MACKCGDGACSCYISGGLKTEVTGFGTEMEPFTIDVEPAFLEAEGTDTVATTITGSGDTDDPYFLSMVLSGLDDLAGKWTGSAEDYEHLAPGPGILYVILGDS